jgi:hypothetical protein
LFLLNFIFNFKKFLLFMKHLLDYFRQMTDTEFVAFKPPEQPKRLSIQELDYEVQKSVPVFLGPALDLCLPLRRLWPSARYFRWWSFSRGCSTRGGQCR